MSKDKELHTCLKCRASVIKTKLETKFAWQCVNYDCEHSVGMIVDDSTFKPHWVRTLYRSEEFII